MAFKHGKNTVVLLDGANLSAYFNEATSSREADMAETTAFGNAAKTYIAGLADGKISLSGMYDGATGAVDSVLNTALTNANDNILTVAPDNGITASGRAFLTGVQESSYEVTSPVADIVTIKAEFQADGGVDNGIFLVATPSITTTSQSTAIDNTVSTSNGSAANLHILSNTMNGNTTFKVQHSADNSAWADLITFAATPATTVQGQRGTSTGTVNRYVRVQYTPAGAGTIQYTLAFARR